MQGRQRITGAHGLLLPSGVVEEIRELLPGVADDVVEAIIAEVPSYTDALGGSMGQTIRNAVQLALGGFLSLASGTRGAGARTPRPPAVDGAYELGRGEARSGRSTDAILSAYRIGAQISWREMSTRAVAAGLGPEPLAAFAELVFAYIDELSAATVAGHTDELATSGRVRQRLMERLVQHLLDRDPAATVRAAAARLDWPPPETLTAVLAPESQLQPLLTELSGLTGTTTASLPVTEAPGLEQGTLVLVPDVHGPQRARLLRSVRARSALAGPARPWLDVRTSYDRAVRARAMGLEVDTEAHLPALVLTADPAALDDLRAAALAPLADLRPTTREKLTETLRAWLLHQGRRDDVATALFVHPQTVRYRMGQLREAFGDSLDDPGTVLRLVLALGEPPNDEPV